MKKIVKSILSFILLVFVLFITASCNKSNTVINNPNEEGSYLIKEIDFYREKDKVDRKVSLRFYTNTPNVPYVGVKQFFHEFYKTELSVKQNECNFVFKKNSAYIAIDTRNEIFSILDIDTLSSHPDFKQSNSIVFVKDTGSSSTTPSLKTVNLNNYSIETYQGLDDAYVPLTFISNIVSGASLFCIVYNEKALYEFDMNGELSNNESRMEEYYGASYKAPMIENTKRKKDLIDFNYNLTCLIFDNLRGYTVQMAFIDNNLLSLGLNGTLEKYYPDIKEALLSEDRIKYIAGVAALFIGLGDGGHTGLLSELQNEAFSNEDSIVNYITSDNSLKLLHNATMGQLAKQANKASLVNLKKTSFNLDDYKFYYHFDNSSKMAYLGFDKFEVNYDGWDSYYKALEKGEPGTIPTNDTYSYVRSKMYKALEDGVETLILDLSTNGGGDSLALIGLVGLLNEGKATFSMNDVVNKSRQEAHHLIDINLDGKYDDKDKAEALKFQDMNIVVLTSSYAFSCGNLYPSLLKELNYKTIGEKTGGGSCAIEIGSMADGMVYVRSSHKCLSDLNGHNIDGGVDVNVNLMGEPTYLTDFPINNYEHFFDINYVSNAIKDLFVKE